MSVIRPYIPPQVQPTTSSPARTTADAKAAQRAFFQQALGDATPVAAAKPASQASTAQASAPAASVQRERPIPEEPPTRILRPGSFVNITV